MANIPIGLRGDMMSNARIMSNLLIDRGGEATLKPTPNGVTVTAAGHTGEGSTMAVAFRRWGESLASGGRVDAIVEEVLSIERRRQGMGS